MTQPEGRWASREKTASPTLGLRAAVVFDLDGTLFDHDDAVLTGVRAWARTLGTTSLAPHEVEQLWLALERHHYERYLTGAATYLEQRRERTSAFLSGLGLPQPDDLDECFAGYLAAYTRAWRAFDDAAATLARVRDAGLHVAVLTNGDLVQQTAKLRATGLLPLCDSVFASSAIGAPKPTPAAFAAVSTALGRTPDQLVMVGDNPRADIEGARAAGWTAVHLDRSRPTCPTSIATLADLSLVVAI
jgi:putative hydrolase of the HAD superfamily